ncbi:hypothetical protein [Microvirus mar57]|uniref:Peptidase M15A C-terminal domain-containing protein n=1 Tax=Microvirus mar57 TaxID=2851193 RepID=A0A8F5XVH7_9VIRU|nr:hypothetical protein [Microvirus mar57]
MEKYNHIKYFKPYEFLYSQTAKVRGIDNCPTDWLIYSNLFYLAYMLDHLRNVYGRPLAITSGYRCPILNKAIGGVRNSRHLYGLAVDIRCLHNTDYEKIYQIIGKYARFIKYYSDKHYIHVDFTREMLVSFYHYNIPAYEK